MSNIYYSPEKFGLVVVAEIEYLSGSYEFDTRVVWKQKDADLFYTARDSGCSCPTPFDDYDLTNIDRLDFNSLVQEVRSKLASGLRDFSRETGQSFLEKVYRAAVLRDE